MKARKTFIEVACLLLLACCAALIACDNDDNSTDTDKPSIMDGESSNPTNCQVYQRGDTIPVRFTFTDNAELGSFNVEIHNNFDHHSHGTEAGECEHEGHDHEEAEATPVNPWVYNRDFAIPSGLTVYEASVDIAIPADIDAGDYHFMVRLTDKAGWQELKALAIEIE